MLNEILENAMIESLAGGFQRSPAQVNRRQETDAELIRLSPGSGTLLAVTTDTLSEEISSGLYDDPYLIGWMTVMANLSDLAAVGARPLGMLVSEVFGPDFPDEARPRLQQGIMDACGLCGTFVLGGDTNIGRQTLMTGSAIGILERGRHLSRLGCLPGDAVYATRRIGQGNAFALARFLLRDGKSIDYKPVARLAEGKALLGIASSCMDTSDGVLATLDQMMRLNGAGFQFESDWEEALDPDSRALARAAGIAPWLLLAGHHGEFELLFTVPPCLEETLSEVMCRGGWSAVRLGCVIEEREIRLPVYGGNHLLDTAEIRNLAADPLVNAPSYIGSLLRMDAHLRSS